MPFNGLNLVLASLHMLVYGINAQDCRNYILMSVRGTSEPQGPSRSFPGMINTTLTGLTNGIEYDVMYPASTDLTANLGADDIKRYIDAGLKSCPEQQYAILGYSQGAAAAALALGNYMDEEADAFKAIKAVVVVGNPGHLSGSSANVDQNGGNTTRDYNGAFFFNGALALPKVYYSSNKILDICYQRDPICAPGYPNASFIPAHTSYGPDQNVQKMGSDFLISKLQGTQSNPVSSSSTATPISTQVSPTGSPTTSISPTTSPGAASNTRPSLSLSIIIGLFALFIA